MCIRDRVMKFSDDNGTIDYESVGRYIKRYIPSREDFEQYKFQMVNGDTVQFLARVRVSVDVKTGKTCLLYTSSVVDIDADKRNQNLWREYIVGDDMENLVDVL